MTTVYLVSAVSYGSDHKINLLRQHEDTGGAIEKGELVERAKVASIHKKRHDNRIIRRISIMDNEIPDGMESGDMLIDTKIPKTRTPITLAKPISNLPIIQFNYSGFDKV